MPADLIRSLGPPWRAGATHDTISDMERIGGSQMPLPKEASAGLLGQASCDRRARAWPRKRRCPLRFGIDNHDNVSATTEEGRNIQV
jgi:hypothetical protein